MKLKKIILGLFLLGSVIGLVACTNGTSNNSGNKTPGNVTEENVIVSIEATATNEEGYLNCNYVPKNVIVYAVYKDGTKINVTNKAKYKVSTEKLGKATVTVTYETFTTTYDITIVENAPTNLSYFIAGSKLTYTIGEVFDSSIISVFVNYLDGSQEKIEDYTIGLYLNDDLVSELSYEGTYEVRINATVKGKSLNDKYYILVTNGQYVDKVYLNLMVDENSLNKDFEDESFNYDDLKVYAVTMSGNELLTDKDYTVSLYYQNVKVDDFSSSGKYQVVIRYIGVIKCLNAELSYDVNYSKTGPEVVVPSITINSTSEIVIDLLETNPIQSYNIVLKDKNNNLIKNITSLSTKVSNLDSTKEYVLSGSYVLVGNKTVNVSDTVISTNLYTSFEEIDYNSTIVNIAGNSLAIDKTQFIESAPAGYALKYFELLDSDFKLIEVVELDDSNDDLYFTNLEAESSYLLRPCYERISQSVVRKNSASISPYFEADNGYTYNFKFVGYWYVTGSDVNYRIRMRYNGTTLYTWYVSDVRFPMETSQYCSFALPNELADYEIIGTKTNLYGIKQDTDAEVILAKKNTGSTCRVTFYGWHGMLIDYQDVASGSAVTAPSVTPKMSFNGIEYNFVAWSKDFSNVTYNLEVHAIYRSTEDDSVEIKKIELHISDRSVAIYTSFPNYSAMVSFQGVLEDLSGATPTRTSEENRYSWLVGDLTPGTNYRFTWYVTYNLNDGNGDQLAVKSKEFTTLDEGENLGINLTWTFNKYISTGIMFKATGGQPFDIMYDTTDRIYFRSFAYYDHIINPDTVHESAFHTLYQGDDPDTTYYFYFGVKDSKDSDVIYMYDSGKSYTYSGLPTPEIEKVIFNQKTEKFYLVGQNLTGVYINAFPMFDIFELPDYQQSVAMSYCKSHSGNRYEFNIPVPYGYAYSIRPFITIDILINGMMGHFEFEWENPPSYLNDEIVFVPSSNGNSGWEDW